MAEADGDNKPFSRWLVVPLLALGFVVALIVHQFGSMAAAEATGISVPMFALALITFWSRRKEKWVWPYFCTMGLAHVVFILVMPWSHSHKFTKGDLVYGWVDFALYWATSSLVDKLNQPSSTHRKIR